MLVTLLGMVIDVRLLQSWKAYNPMLVTLLGMVIDVRLLQFVKAEIPIVVNCESSANKTDIRPVHFMNILNIDNQLVMC